MSFIQPCFIRKNTPELRKKLEELGYTNGAWESPHFEYPYLMCFPNKNGKYGLFKGEGFYMTEDDYRCDGERWIYNPPKEYINCGDNEELFLALAALRDDTPINNFYWFNRRLVKCEDKTEKHTFLNGFIPILKCRCVDDPNICFGVEEDFLKKASVEEFIEKF